MAVAEIEVVVELKIKLPAPKLLMNPEDASVTLGLLELARYQLLRPM